MNASTIALLAGSGFAAGGINAVAGGGSLVSFPALLLAGYSPLDANVTNAVALLPGYLGGSVGYRRELQGQRPRLERLGAASIGGAVLGAFLLLAGPAGVFQHLVPWLILGACALLVAQPYVARRVAARQARGDGRRNHEITGTLLAAEAVCAVYGAYFGAGVGVVTLAVLGIFLSDSLQRINALKGLLSLIINVVAVVYFVIFAHVAWIAVAVMAPISFAGGMVGVVVARRLDDRVLRISVVLFGVAVAVRLLL